MGSKKARQCSNITSSKLKTDESSWARNQSKEAGDLHAWVGSSQQISNGRKKFVGCREKDRPCGRTVGTSSEYTGMWQGRPRPAWNLIWQGRIKDNNYQLIYQGQQEGFLQVNSKRKNRENVWLLLNQMGVLVLEDTEKIELLNAFSASVFTAENSPKESQTSVVRKKG